MFVYAVLPGGPRASSRGRAKETFAQAPAGPARKGKSRVQKSMARARLALACNILVANLYKINEFCINTKQMLGRCQTNARQQPDAQLATNRRKSFRKSKNSEEMSAKCREDARQMSCKYQRQQQMDANPLKNQRIL